MTEGHTDQQVDGNVHVLHSTMPAEFGLGMATFVVMASMVGAGVLTTSGYTMALIGSNQYMLLLWMIGGVLAICGALTLAELAAALPETGGEYIYLYHAYGPLAAFLSGWVAFVIGFSGPCAASAFGFAKYILAPLSMDGSRAVLMQRGLATLAILVLASIHVSGRRRTARVQGWITGLKLCSLGVLVVAGVLLGWPRLANLHDPKPVDGELLSNMLFSLVYIYYAYTGWNGASYLAGEIRDAQRVLPLAILLGTGAVIFLYLALNAVYALALTATEVQAMVNDPANVLGIDVVAPIAEIAARRLSGARWSNPLSVAIGLMLLSTLSAYLLLGPRVVYAMARAGQFPAVAARLTSRAGTPAIATAFQVAMTLTLLWSGTFERIIVFASVGMLIFSMLSISSIYVLRHRMPKLPRPFRTPGYPLTPAVYLILTLLLTAAAFHQRPRVSAAALGCILAGIPVYYLWQPMRQEKVPQLGKPPTLPDL
jgi:APA family basic amino acid/polyamine antiporter